MTILPSFRFLSLYAPLKPIDSDSKIIAHQSDDIFKLWQEWELECGKPQQVPFWATVWPGAMLLTEFITMGGVDLTAKTVLDIGCGAAVVSIASAKAGASKVIANDVDPVALHVARLNAQANSVVLEYEQADLLAVNKSLPQADVIFVGDMFYNKVLAEKLLYKLIEARKKTIKVYIGEPGRTYAPSEGYSVLYERIIPVKQDIEGTNHRRVRILELK